MMEDNLTPEQRIRLEATALAVASSPTVRSTVEGDRFILTRASKIAEFIKTGGID